MARVRLQLHQRRGRLTSGWTASRHRGFSGYACGGLRLVGDHVAAIVCSCPRYGTGLRKALRWMSRVAGLTVPRELEREHGIVVRQRGHRGT